MDDQQTHITRNAKGIFRQKGKDTGGNTGLPKGMKNTGNDRNMGKHTNFFLI